MPGTLDAALGAVALVDVGIDGDLSTALLALPERSRSLLLTSCARPALAVIAHGGAAPLIVGPGRERGTAELAVAHDVALSLGHAPLVAVDELARLTGHVAARSMAPLGDGRRL